jgi:hypothetical protein
MIRKLQHQFGDDGIFWMSFNDMLDNFKWMYRTRLFDERWTVAQQWTSVSISWLTGYLKKKFIIEVKEEGMVVIVLSQVCRPLVKSPHTDSRSSMNVTSKT